jgi:hypothetical protein
MNLLSVSFGALPRSSQPDIGENESIPLDNVTALDGNRLREHWPGVDEAVKLPVLPAGISVTRQIIQERFVKVASRKFLWQFAGIDADNTGSQTTRDHLASQPVRVKSPNREDGRETGATQPIFAIAPHIFEEKISERNGLNAIGESRLAGLVHGGFVLRVGTRPRKRDCSQWKAGNASLRLDKHAPGTVHSDTIKCGVEGGQQPDDVIFPAPSQAVQRPGTVLAAAPGEKKSAPHLLSLLQERTRGRCRRWIAARRPQRLSAARTSDAPTGPRAAGTMTTGPLLRGKVFS